MFITAETAARVESLASIGMNMREIAELLAISEKRLTRKFGSLFRKKRLEAKERVVRKQYEAACAGVVPMSIWWGKNYGEQSDRQDVTSGGEPLRVIVEKIG